MPPLRMSEKNGNPEFDPSKGINKGTPLVEGSGSYSDASASFIPPAGQRIPQEVFEAKNGGQPPMATPGAGRLDPMLDPNSAQNAKATGTIEKAQKSDQNGGVKAPGLYAYFVLILVTLIRTAYVINKNSIGYAFGF